MSKLFSPKELIKLYNRIKITYNPSGYSFRDRLIEYDRGIALRRELATVICYDTEQELLSKIYAFWKSTSSPILNYGRLGSSSNEYDAWHREWTALPANRAQLVLPQPNSSVFVNTDHLCFSTHDVLCNLPKKLGDEILKNNILEGLITACYILTTPKSISADLKWACTNMHTRFDYENLHSLQFLKDALAKKEPGQNIRSAQVFARLYFSSTAASGAFFRTLSMPFSQEAFAVYPSDTAIISPLRAFRRKRNSSALSL
jgi:hypothetical protein